MSNPEAQGAKPTAIPEEYLLKEEPEQNPEAQKAEGVKATPPEEIQDDVPEKFRGKTPAELIEMYRNAESELGRARNEIGSVRRLADELLGINRAAIQKSDNQPQRKPLTTDDLLQNPEQAVVEVVRAEAQAREAGVSDRVAALEAQLQLARLEQKHPGYQSTIQDPKFVEWLQKTPLRVQAAQAAMQGNYAAADELLTLYKETQPVAGAPSATPTDRARQAGLVRSGGAASAAASNPATSKQIWSREKLLDMRINNPGEFERLQTEILQAYREKRVR